MTHPGAFRLSSWFNTQVITAPQDLQAIYRLRYRVYCEERGFFPPGDYPDGVECDAYDAHSVNFAAFDQDGLVAAAVRLVCPDEARGLPYQQHCPLFDDILLPDPARSGEVSRLVLNKGFRTPPGGGSTGTVVMEVYRAMYQYSREQGIRYWYAAMERPLVRMLARIGVVFERIGPRADYCGPVAPYLLDLEELDRHLACCNPDFLQFLSSTP
ncbi:GNAT family N-acyltransferase [Haliea sp.]